MSDSHIILPYTNPAAIPSFSHKRPLFQHHRLRSGSRSKLLFAPKPKLELTWKYSNNDSYNSWANSRTEDEGSLSPSSLDCEFPRNCSSEPLKPVVISDISKAMKGLVLAKKGSSNELSLENNNELDASSLITSAPVFSVSKKTIRNKRHSANMSHVVSNTKETPGLNNELKKRLKSYGDFSVALNRHNSSSNVNSPKDRKQFFRHHSYSGPDSHANYTVLESKTSNPKEKNDSIPSLVSMTSFGSTSSYDSQLSLSSNPNALDPAPSLTFKHKSSSTSNNTPPLYRPSFSEAAFNSPSQSSHFNLFLMSGFGLLKSKPSSKTTVEPASISPTHTVTETILVDQDRSPSLTPSIDNLHAKSLTISSPTTLALDGDSRMETLNMDGIYFESLDRRPSQNYNML